MWNQIKQQTKGPSGFRAVSALSLALLAIQSSQAQIEEVVVTAQKREQSLQEVPLAVSTFDAEAISSARIDDLEEIALRTPSFDIGQNGPSAPEMTIRGIGSTDREAGSDRSVVVFVDEVYIGRAGASTFDLFDMERIEVLRGPQGSIFGRNVVGGSVNFITARPRFEEETKMEVSAGSLSLWEAKGVLNRPLSESLAARLSLSANGRDGYYENRQFDNKTTNNTESLSSRLSFLYEPSDSLQWLFTLEASTDEVDGIGSAITQGATSDAEFNAEFANRFGGTSRPHPDLLGRKPDATAPYPVDNNEFGFFERDILALSVRLDATTDIGVITLLPAFRDTSFSIVRDLVGIPIGHADRVQVTSGTLGYANGLGFESTAINDEDYTAQSVELRLASLPDSAGPASWLLGLYYLSEETHRIQIRERQLSQVSSQTISRPRFDQNNDVTSAAIFGQLRWDISDSIGLTLGARYTRDEKDFSLAVANTIDAATEARIKAAIPNARIALSPATAEFSAEASETFSEFTPEVTVDFQVSEQAFLYAKWSTGFKSGGFVGLGANASQATRPFQPETVLNQELGFKGDLFDRRLRLNANIFLMDFEELQLRDRQLLVPGDEASAIVTTVNAAKAEIRGLEADIIIHPAANLFITGGLSVLETEITEVAQGSDIRVGTELPKAPEFSTNWSFDYTFENVGNGHLRLRAEALYRGSLFFDINEDTAGAEPSRSLYNLNLSYAPDDERWDLTLWGKNLTNEYYRTQVQSALRDKVGIISTLGEPRTYGLTFRLNLSE